MSLRSTHSISWFCPKLTVRTTPDPHESLRPVSEVTNLTWKPPADTTASEIGAAIQKDLRVKAPMNCQACHR